MIKDIKDLERLLKLCRKQGVTKISLGEVTLELGDMPAGKPDHATENDADSGDPWKNFPPGELTAEQLAYYSSGGTPENDPFRGGTEQ